MKVHDISSEDIAFPGESHLKSPTTVTKPEACVLWKIFLSRKKTVLMEYHHEVYYNEIIISAALLSMETFFFSFPR